MRNHQQAVNRSTDAQCAQADTPLRDRNCGRGRNSAMHWRSMLRGLIAAPLRIHHYRDLHSRMLRDALCDLDCRSKSG